MDENKYYKLIFTGYKNIEINTNKIMKILNIKNIIKMKDLSKIKIDLEKIKEENNLKEEELKFYP